MEIWVNFEKSKNMGNVDMGKILKTLPIMVCQYMGKYSTYDLEPKKEESGLEAQNAYQTKLKSYQTSQYCE